MKIPITEMESYRNETTSICHLITRNTFYLKRTTSLQENEIEVNPCAIIKKNLTKLKMLGNKCLGTVIFTDFLNKPVSPAFLLRQSRLSREWQKTEATKRLLYSFLAVTGRVGSAGNLSTGTVQDDSGFRRLTAALHVFGF